MAKKKGKKNKNQKQKDIPEYFPLIEDIVDLQMTQRNYPDTPDLRNFYRILVIHAMAKVPAMLHCTIDSPLLRNIPINIYAATLAVSGLGKNRTINHLDNHIFKKAYGHILNHTMPTIQEVSLRKYAEELAALKDVKMAEEDLKKAKEAKEANGVTDEEEIKPSSNIYYELEAQVGSLGEYFHKFETATAAAIKQLCTRIQLTHCGSLNLFIDELAMSISGSSEALKEYLTLYDEGTLGKALLKNTKENTRIKSPDRPTPANLLMVGTPHNLLDGALNQKLWEMLLSTGYARRSLFAYIPTKPLTPKRKVEELYLELIQKASTVSANKISDRIYKIVSKYKGHEVFPIDMEADVEILRYQIECADKANKIPNEAALLKIHTEHRHFPMAKLAGLFAFWDSAGSVQLKHVKWAIRCIEDTTVAFTSMIEQPRDFQRVVHYLAQRESPASHADLIEALAFYPKNKVAQNDLLKLASAYARSNNFILDKTEEYEIEYFNVTKLKSFKGKDIPVAYAKGIEGPYKNKKLTIESMEQLILEKGLYFTNHQILNKYDGERKEKFMRPGNAFICLDIDEGVSIGTVELILQDYEYILYTTKSHTKKKNHFRIILFLDHYLKLNENDFKGFMTNIFDFLPFIQDTQVAQRSRAWATNHKAKVICNKGKYFPVFNFIPRTQNHTDYLEKRAAAIGKFKNTDQLELWLIDQAEEGNRNNLLLRYCKVLTDRDEDNAAITDKVLELNSRFDQPLLESEVQKTVLNKIGNYT